MTSTKHGGGGSVLWESLSFEIVGINVYKYQLLNQHILIPGGDNARFFFFLLHHNEFTA